MSPCESTQRRKVELLARNVREFCLNADLHVTFSDLLHAVKLQHGADGFTSPPKEGVLRIFCPKNPTALAGCEPANLGTKGLDHRSRLVKGKVKCTLVQALRLCAGRTAHRGSKAIALLFHDHSTRRE